MSHASDVHAARSIRLLASKERHYVGLSGFGIEIAATEKLEA